MGENVIGDALDTIEKFYKKQKDRQLKWDKAWIKKAKEFSEFSKDPSTKTGAVIIGSDNEQIGAGYNGFAIGVDDDEERYNNRELKYEMVVHCEVNAYIFGDKTKMKGATLYTWPFMSCSRCAAIMIQAGIKRCVAPKMPKDKEERWKKNMDIAKMQFAEAGVKLVEIEGIYEELTNE